MGNHVATGHVVAMTGLPQAVGFQRTLETLMVQNSIQPWAPKQLLHDNLQAQLELAARSPLRSIDVTEGLAFYGKHVGGVLAPLTREKFVQMSLELFRLKGLHCPPEEACLCYDVFDAVALYQNASLSLGEMAGGLSSFFC